MQKSSTISARMEDALAEKLSEMARKKNVAVSQVLREMIANAKMTPTTITILLPETTLELREGA